MKKTVLLFVFVLAVNFCFATTVYFRKGGTIEGEVISKDDEKFVLRMADGEEKTIKWGSVKNKTIKEIYPELYESLKEKALAKKKKKGETKKKETDFSRIYLYVKTAKKTGPFKKMNLRNSSRKFRKESQVFIVISLSGLDPKKEYTVRTIYSHYLKTDNKHNMPLSKLADEKNIVKEEKISGKSNHKIEIATAPYYFYKRSAKSGFYIKKTSGGKYLTKIKYGYKTDGLDISVWLNDTLVYEKKKGKKPIFYNNISH